MNNLDPVCPLLFMSSGSKFGCVCRLTGQITREKVRHKTKISTLDGVFNIVDLEVIIARLPLRIPTV